MPVVMERDRVTVIPIDPRCGNDRAAKVASDVFCDDFGIAFIGFGIDIEAMFMFFIADGFDLLKGRAKMGCHFIQEGGTESIPQIRVVEMLHITPEAVIAVSPF